MTPSGPNTESLIAEATDASIERKLWSTPVVIVASVRETEGGTTRFTDGTSLGVPYGS